MTTFLASFAILCAFAVTVLTLLLRQETSWTHPAIFAISYAAAIVGGIGIVAQVVVLVSNRRASIRTRQELSQTREGLQTAQQELTQTREQLAAAQAELAKMKPTVSAVGHALLGGL